MKKTIKVQNLRKVYINAIRENGQRNYINQGLTSKEGEDIILISDVDEIPNMSNIDFGH